MNAYRSQAIVFPAKQQVALWEETVDPPGAGEILCRAERSLVSLGTELHCLRGEFDPGTNWIDWVQYPFHTGYSMVGRVVEIGAGVTQIRLGDRIASYTPHQQYYTVRFDHQPPGTPEGIRPYVLPDGISNDEGTWRSLACTTQSAMRRAEFQFGETAVVIGLGILGQLVTQYLAAAGARRIIAIDTAPNRLELARASGATHTLALDVKDAVEPIRDLTGGWMADVCFDVTGHHAVLSWAVRLVRRLGRLVLVGDTPTPSRQTLGPGVVSHSVAILGIHGYQVPDKANEYAPWSVDTMSDLFFDYCLNGRMNVRQLVTSHHSPLEAPALYQRLYQDRSSEIGVILDWERLDG